jgi:carboxymethylenebutenolidase
MPDQQPDQQPDEAAEPQQNVTFPSNGSTAHGYLEVPESGSGAGVGVIQAWWGLTTHMGDVVRRLAAEGFVALAPDLYGGSTTHDSAEAMQLAQTLPQDRAAGDLAGAVDYLLGLDAVTSSTVGVIGFCMGGGFVLRLAAREGDRVSAAVPFYGFPGADFDPAGLTAAVQGHYGQDDHSIEVAAVEAAFAKIRVGGASAELFTYPAGHAFYNDENLLGTYDREQAELAWSRASAFLRDTVR